MSNVRAVSGTRLQLNGWQRLWVVLATLWMVVVIAVGYEQWPAGTLQVPLDRLTLETPPGWTPVAETRTSDGFFNALARLYGGKVTEDLVAEELLSAPSTDDVRAEAVRAFYFSANRDELIRKLRPLPLPDSVKSNLSSRLWQRRQDELAAKRSVITLAQQIRAKYPTEYADLSDAELEQRVLAKYPELKDLARPGQINFDAELRQMTREPLRVVRSEPLPFSERHALAINRTRLSGQLLVLWAIPAIVLYGLGWSVGWIRRGFTAQSPGAPAPP